MVKIDGPATASGSPTSFLLSVAEYWPLSTHPTYTYFIDWEGDGIEDFSLSSGEPITVTHTYPPGVFELKVRAVVLGGENPIEPASWTIRNPAPSIRVISAPLQAVPYEPLNVTLAVVGFSANGVYPIGVDYDNDGVYDALFPLTQPTETITLQLPRWNFVSKIRFDFLDARGIAATTSFTLESLLAKTRVIDGKIVLVVGGTAANDELIVSTNEYGTTILSYKPGSSNPLVSNYSESVSQVIIYAGPGNDLVDASSFDGTVFVEGGGGNDTIIGTLAPDTLFGGLGNDSIEGGAGDDLIVGDGGEGSKSKNLGHDTIYGGEGYDTIYGDRVTGDADGAEGGNDLLYGDGGDDFIDARTGRDSAYGGEGTDTIVGVIDSDLLILSSARTTLNGSTNGARVGAESITTSEIDPTSIRREEEKDAAEVPVADRTLLSDIALSVDDEDEPLPFDLGIEEGISVEPWPTVEQV